MSPYEPRPEGLNTQPAPPSVVETLKPHTWHKGPPPHVGWWLARPLRTQEGGLWRWWNGLHWSVGTVATAMTVMIESAASIPALWAINELEWSDYWPENARVPRVNPNEVEA